MESPTKPTSSTQLFQVYLRLRPPPSSLVQVTSQSLYPLLNQPERYLSVEPPSHDDEHGMPTHITLNPPSDSRKRAVEKFAFTKVFEEDATQLDIFKGAGVVPLIEGVVSDRRDGLLATLGVTGSGKSHTILGSKTQRGLTQMALEVLFRSLGPRILNPSSSHRLVETLAAADASEAQLISAASFLEKVYGDGLSERLPNSRAATPMTESSYYPTLPRKHVPQRPSTLPQLPDVGGIAVDVDVDAEYAILISMYEVYNDRIFDLLAHARNPKELRRRPLLFKSTEASPDRKVVAGLRKVVCGNFEDALMVLEGGLMERRVAGTGSNSVSSRSHGFFCVEVRHRQTMGEDEWKSSQMTIVDLAGSERARNAKTAGATLAEAGKINESLMYLGQCLQMQSSCHDGAKPSVVPYRQCKLTELLFSNSFPATNGTHSSHHRNPQKAIMIVTADPVGDFNATSQILRYSALAREVTVPRIPSVTSTILSGTAAIVRNQGSTGRASPSQAHLEEMEAAVQEITRLGEELDTLHLRLMEEENRRREAEVAWKAAEERAEMVEEDVRDECWTEFEKRLEEEQRRWKSAWDEELDRNDEHVDRKLEIFSRAIKVHEDPRATNDERVTELENENSALRQQLKALEQAIQRRSPMRKTLLKTSISSAMSLDNTTPEQELHLGSPTKKKTAKISTGSAMSIDNAEAEIAGVRLEGLSLENRPLPKTPAKTPKPKQRKLTTRKWDLATDD